jgi:PadR family transcriptional regulator AphA
MDRRVGRMWSRAASVVYEEPKRLVRAGLAEAATHYTGKRASTVYSITDAGRAALAEWLAVPGGDPTLEFEALLKVAFAEHGSLEALRANLAAIREYAEADRAEALLRMEEYATTGGPYPQRLPVISLASRYFVEQSEALLRWIAWAEAAVEAWSGVTPDTGAWVPDGAFAADPVSEVSGGT